jgi:signal transduction histidine kinase
MSHGMRTPLNGLLGMLQLAELSSDLFEVKDCLNQARHFPCAHPLRLYAALIEPSPVRRRTRRASCSSR